MNISTVTAQIAGVRVGVAVEFLQSIRSQSWELMSGIDIKRFPAAKPHDAADFIVARQRAGEAVFCILPTFSGGHYWLAARLPLTDAPSRLKPRPQAVIMSDDFLCLYRLASPVTRARAVELTARIIGCGGRVAIGEPVPLPGTVLTKRTGIMMAVRFPVRVMRGTSSPSYRVSDAGELLCVLGTPAAVDADDGFQRADEIAAEALRELWPGVLPVELCLLAGEPKIGKSGIACDLAARITRGLPWPDGAKGCEPGGVIMIENEDPEAITRGRLDAAGADLRRVRVSKRILDLSAPAGLAVLSRQADAIGGELRALFLSPIRVFFGEVEASRQIDMRGRLGPLLAWADAWGCAVIGIAHREAGNASRSAEAVAGPKAIGQRARAALSAMVDPADPLAKSDPKQARRILTSLGSNHGGDGFALPYRIVSAGASSRVVWGE
jgi:hypothetical protein